MGEISLYEGLKRGLRKSKEYTDDKTSQLSESIMEIFETEKLFLNNPFNLINKFRITDDYYMNMVGDELQNTNYYHTGKIDVSNILQIASPIGIRYVTAFNGDVVIEESGLNHSSYDSPCIYTIPNGVTHIVISINKTVAPIESALVFEYKGRMNYYLPSIRTIKKESLNDGISKADRMSVENMLRGTMYELPVNNIHKNKQINCYCEIDGEFKDFRVGHGYRIYNANYVQITPTEYIVYGYQTSDIEVRRGNHGLNINTFIDVSITCNDNAKATIVITTNGGTVTIENVDWTGNNGSPFMRWYSADAILPIMKNALLTFNTSDYHKPIYAFGDSYLNTLAINRYPYYVKSKGIDTWLLDGFPGRNSESAIESFRNVIKKDNPKYVLWLLGMNDEDFDGNINNSWKNCVDEVIAYCVEHNIEPILATIPCVPTRRNDRKNIYVKSRGFRYIDFAKAVGGEAVGSSWYNGFLSEDGIHPSVEGAKALANRLFLDFPEIINN